MTLFLDRLASPMGPLLVVAAERALKALEFEDHEERLMGPLRARLGAVRFVEHDDPLGATSAMRAYLEGDLAAIGAVPADGDGSPFERRVWAALRRIPAGTTTSYGALAKALGLPGSARAVGLANGRNPIGIVVPCHRVIGADGSLTGYGGGLERKRWLLEHEGVLLRLG